MLKSVLQTFIYVTAGITISAAIFTSLFVQGFVLSSDLLWQIIGMAAVCATGNFVYYSKKELSKRQMAFRIICHYLYINLLVFVGAFLWEWIRPGILREVLVMLLLIAVVYAIVTIVSFQKEERTAKDLNLMLRKNNSAGEEK